LALPSRALAATETLEIADRSFAATDTPPDGGSDWTPVTLPADMSAEELPRNAHIWYRLDVNLTAAPTEITAVYIPHISMNVALFVNEQPIGDSSEAAAYEKMNWNTPQYFELSPRQLHEGLNRIYVRLYPATDNESQLSRVTIGPAAELVSAYRARFFFQVIGPFVVTVLDACIGIFMLALWLRQRHEMTFGWFGLVCLIWAARNAHFFVRDPHIPAGLWFALSHASVAWLVFALTVFIFRFVGRRHSRVENSLALYAALSTVALLLTAGEPSALAVQTLFFLSLLPIGVGVVGYLTWVAWRTREPGVVGLSMGAFVCLAFGGVDFYSLVFSFSHAAPIYIMPYGSLAMIATACASVASRIVNSRREIEALSSAFDTRVAGHQAELERTYAVAAQRGRSAAVAEERQRIMRDMHDDLGVRLMSSIPLARQGALAPEQFVDVLRDCLDSLRLSIDSLKPLGNDLNAVLGNLRHRLESRVVAAGLRFEWGVQDLPHHPKMTAEVVLQITRVVQEAIVNVLRHAQAQRLRVSACFDETEEAIEICVADDGRGFDTNARPTGEGLMSMAARARSIGGEIAFTSAPGDTQVRLTCRLM
jgi:signal transduction histidine kinase